LHERDTGGVDDDPRAWTRHQRHGGGAPDDDLVPFLAHIWTAEWDYATPHRQTIAALPRVHVTVRPGDAPQVQGVARRPVVRVLEGRGRVVGAAFRPGTFRAVLGRAVSTLTDHQVPAAALGLAGGPADPYDADALQAWLRAVLPDAPDAAGREAEAIVERVAADTGLTRVDRLAADAGRSVRSLQRLFAEHVGVGPKWVIRRYRLREITARLEAGRDVEWAALAADLGYADQAHLTRDVADLLGEPPTRHARRYPPPSGHEAASLNVSLPAEPEESPATGAAST
jgi:AraC-like DNA-binding protein